MDFSPGQPLYFQCRVVEFRFSYTGRELDEETGQYYYRARYYDALTGKFTSQDPIGFNGKDANLYRYVYNSALNYEDPTGKIAPLAVAGGAVLLLIAGEAIRPDGAQTPTSPGDNVPGLDRGLERALIECFLSGGTSLIRNGIGRIGGSLLGAAGNAVDDFIRATGDDITRLGPRLQPATGTLGSGARNSSGFGQALGGAVDDATGAIRNTGGGVHNQIDDALKPYFESTSGSGGNEGGYNNGWRDAQGKFTSKNGGNSKIGGDAEQKVSDLTGKPQNTKKYDVDGQDRIPDQVISTDKSGNPTHVVEVKDVGSLSKIDQINDLEKLVGPNGRVDVYVRPDTNISGPLQRSFDDPTSPLTKKFIP